MVGIAVIESVRSIEIKTTSSELSSQQRGGFYLRRQQHQRLVEEPVLSASEEIRQKAISKLNNHQRVVYEVLEQDGPLIQKELYERYSANNDDPVTLRYLREKHLPNLEHYGLTKTNRNGSGKEYAVS